MLLLLQVDDDHVIFDLMNEPNGIAASTVFDLVSARFSGLIYALIPKSTDAGRHQRRSRLGCHEPAHHGRRYQLDRRLE